MTKTTTQEQADVLAERAAADEKPELKLTGTDGNAFSVIGRARKTARRAGWTAEELEALVAEMTSGDYDNVLATAMKYFDVT